MNPPRSFRAVLACGLAAAVACMALTAGGALPALAATPASSLRLLARAAPRQPGALRLVATLERPGKHASPTRASLAGDQVTFSVHLAQFAGAPLLVLGSATTDAAGEATLTYRPTWLGRQALVATATSPRGNTLGSAATSVTALSASHPFAGTVEASRPDGVIGRWVAGTLLAVLAVLWVTLVALVVRVNFGLGRGPRPGQGEVRAAAAAQEEPGEPL